MDQMQRAVRDTYDQIAEAYADYYFHEFDHKPLDRELLDRFAAQVRGRGLVCDLGCGPGEVAHYLRSRSVEMVGVDLSPRMVAVARRLNPGIEFTEGNMLALDVPTGAWAGIAAFYCIIHIPREKVGLALQEMKRVLMPGGRLLLAFHVGQETLHLDEWWGQPVSADFIFFEKDEMEGYLRAAGFEIEETVERPPYLNVERQSQRAYISARKPAPKGVRLSQSSRFE
jgi:SAM-dependent methyltransferase